MSLFYLETLFADFIKEKTFLCDLSVHTLRSYRVSFDKFKKYVAELNKPALTNFVVGMREEGLKPGGCNVKIRAINSFLSWCFENNHTTEHLKIKQIRTSQPVLKIFSDAHIRALLRYKPKGGYQWRMWAVTCLMIDSGARISEALELKISDINYDQLLITISGKGDKERIIPISIELRKILWSFQTKHRFKVYSDFLFCTKEGTSLMYRNYMREMREWCARLGITEVRPSPHGFRHYYAIHYLRQNGDIYRLSRILGHSNVSTTEVYLRSMGVEIIREAHQRLSPLGKI